MTDRSRRSIALLGAAAVTVALATRAAGCSRQGETGVPRPRPAAAPQAVHGLTSSAGEGAERPGGERSATPSSVTASARRAVAVYRAFERHPRSRHARALLGRAFSAELARRLVADPPRTPGHELPALRPLVVTPDGRGRFSVTVLTRRGELYLVLELQQIRDRVVVTALG
jgi:hypothetical protein